MGTWQLQHAKARLSELVESVATDGPQIITRHGEQRAALIPIEDYERFYPQSDSFKEFLLGPPYVDDFVIPRSRDRGRKISL